MARRTAILCRSGCRPCKINAAARSIILVLLALAVPAFGETARFSATVDGVARNAAVEVTTVGETEYVPLLSLAQQLGGEGRLIGTRVQMDFAGHSAFAGIDSTEVNASAARFNLGTPLLRHDSGPLIARDEAASFFQQAFQVTVDVNAAEAALVPAEETPLEESTDMLLEESLLEPVVLPTKRALSGMIAVDPGHGGTDAGIVGAGGTEERAITKAVADALRNALKETTGLGSVITREGDDAATDAQRRGVAADAKADLLVSIHTSGSPAPQANGISIYYSPDSGTMGNSVAQRLAAAHANGNAAVSRVAAQAIHEALKESGQRPVIAPREIPLRLMHGAGFPGVLIEIGYLSNPVEERLLNDAGEQNRLAQDIAKGIKNAMTQLQEGSAR